MSSESESEWQPEDGEDELESQGMEEFKAEEDDADAEDLEDDFQDARLDPFALLENMAANNQEADYQAGIQPYEILAHQARQARENARPKAGKSQQKRKAADMPGASSEEEAGKNPKRSKKAQGAFGATVEDIWNDDMAAQMGLGSSKAQKKHRNKLRRRRKAQRAGKKTRDLPEEVTKKIGEANLLYALGKYSEAIPLLKDVIRLAPSLADPYHTLGMLYQAVGDSRVALDFYMIAAHLTPKDADLWKRLAALSAEMGFVRQAIYCLSKVIVRDKTDVDARWDQAMLYTEIEEYRKAVVAFEQIQQYKKGDGEVPLMLTRLHHRLKQPDKACQALENHISSFPLATKATHVNILAELYMAENKYQKAADLIQKTASLVDTSTGPLIDLQIKLTICYIHLGRLEDARPGLDKLKAEATEELYDLCLDAADALLEVNLPLEALDLYRIIKEGGPASNITLWNKMLQCYDLSGDFDGAVQMFSDILLDSELEIDGRREATVCLAEMLAKAGKANEAMQVLEALEDLGPIPHEIQTRKAQALLELRAYDEYLAVMLPVLEDSMKHFAQTAKPQGNATLDAKAREAKQRKAIIAKKKKNAGKDGIFKGYVTQDRRKEQRKQDDEKLATMLESSSDDEDGDGEEGEGLQVYDGRSEEQFSAILQTANVLMTCGQPLQAAELLSECLTHFGRRWHQKEKKDKVRILASVAALQAGEPAMTLHHIRHAISSWPHINAVWNLFCKATVAQGSVRNVQKLLLVMSQSFSKCLPLRMAIGHCHSMNGYFGSAMEEYLAAYSMEPKNTLILLCLGINYLNQAMTRKVPNRDQAVLAAFAFLQKYAKLRKNKQEAFYNLGRAAHQLNLTHLAVPWYQQALAAQAPTPLQTLGDPPQGSTRTDLTRATAYNLSKIYTASGADELARQVLRQYLTI